MFTSEKLLDTLQASTIYRTSLEKSAAELVAIEQREQTPAFDSPPYQHGLIVGTYHILSSGVFAEGPHGLSRFWLLPSEKHLSRAMCLHKEIGTYFKDRDFILALLHSVNAGDCRISPAQLERYKKLNTFLLTHRLLHE